VILSRKVLDTVGSFCTLIVKSLQRIHGWESLYSAFGAYPRVPAVRGEFTPVDTVEVVEAGSSSLRGGVAHTGTRI